VRMICHLHLSMVATTLVLQASVGVAELQVWYLTPLLPGSVLPAVMPSGSAPIPPAFCTWACQWGTMGHGLWLLSYGMDSPTVCMFPCAAVKTCTGTIFHAWLLSNI
jgi:hypothetical protein